MKRFQNIVKPISYSFQLLSLIRFQGICFAVLALFHCIEAKSIVSLHDSNVFSNNDDLGIDEIMGFADINEDNFTDIFYVTDDRSQLKVMLMNGDSPYNERELIRLGDDLTSQGNKIRSILLEKFARKTTLDMVILISSEVNGPYKVYYRNFIANTYQQIILYSQQSIASFLQQPLLFYYSQNDPPELLAIDAASRNWKIWCEESNNFDVTRTISSLNDQIIWNSEGQPMHSLFFDIDLDNSKEVMLTDYDDNLFAFYKHSTSAPYEIDFAKPYKTIHLPANAIKSLKPIEADWCLQNRVELLLAYCTAISCKDGYSKFGVFNINDGSNWMDVPIRENLNETTENVDNTAINRPLITSMRKADLNMDNYSDVVVTLIDEKKDSFIGVLVNNCSQGRLAFSMKQFKDIQASEVIPFDFMENGILDLLTNREKSMKIYKVNLKENCRVSDKCDCSDSSDYFFDSDSFYRSNRPNKLKILIIAIIVGMIVAIGLAAMAVSRYLNVLHTTCASNQGTKHNFKL